MAQRYERLALLYKRLSAELAEIKTEERKLRLRIGKEIDEEKKTRILNFITQKG